MGGAVLSERLIVTQKFDNALHLMEVQGGSFVKSLAHCYYMADTVNKTKLREAFADYFDRYEARFLEWQAKSYAPQDNAQHEGAEA